MTVKIKLTADELRYLDNKTCLVFAMKPTDLPNQKKAAYTIMLDVADKVMSKGKKLNRQLTITDNKKKYDVTLKWHEAETLQMYLEGFCQTEHDDYKANLVRKIISQLNQKLA